MDVGRNEPCPCGSGKKYKKCCGKPIVDELASAASLLRTTQESAESRVWRYIRDELGDGALDQAMDKHFYRRNPSARPSWGGPQAADGRPNA